MQNILYLGCQRPLLHSTVEYLAGINARPPKSTTWDLSSCLLVLPTARGRRRLRVLIEQAAQRKGLELKYPSTITIGELPERLFNPPVKIASELEQILAWTQAFAATSDEALSALLTRLPPRDSMTPWLELASTIAALHGDLAAGEMSFDDVSREVTSENEKRRWQLLQSLRHEYIRQLNDADRIDPYLARSQAIAGGRCHCHQRIILVGTSDLNRSTQSLLRGLPADTNLTALVAAQERDRDHFDSFGSIIPSRWAQRILPLTDEHLISADDVPDQAEKTVAVVRSFANPSDARRPDGVTIGVTDPSLVAPVEFELRVHGMSSHRELGWTLDQTSVGRLMQLLADHLARNTWRSLAALVRHADMFDHVSARKQSNAWLKDLDNLIGTYFPTRCDVELSSEAKTKCPSVLQIQSIIDESLSKLRGRPRSISHWASDLSDWLQTLYPIIAADRDKSDDTRSRTDRGIVAAFNYLDQIRLVDSRLDTRIPIAVAIEWLTTRLELLRVNAPLEPCEATIAGWLDLMLDDAPSMVITSLNQPYVPESVTGDPFLPGGLRSRLQLNDNERRLARDLHSMEVILSCRKNVRFIVGSRSLDGSPTPPSRLLAAAKPIDAARRLVTLLQPDRSQPASKPIHPWIGEPGESRLPIPTLPTGRIVTGMSVTSFKNYLVCPYRFFLRHVLGIRPLDDAASELAANQFGDLVHDTLEKFGKQDGGCELSEIHAIRHAVQDHLSSVVLARYGNDPGAAVRFQVELTRRRLDDFATVQSARRQAGWMIDKVEAPLDPKKNPGIDVDGERMPIVGRIDRIDKHEDGRWAIIDYKTHGHHPRKKHIKMEHGNSRWLDLQLPLYQLLVPFVIPDVSDVSRVSLSYFNIGNNESETGIRDADFSAAEYQQARAVIDQCVRGIRNNHFEPNEDVEFDDYAMILQTSKMPVDDEVETEATANAFQS